MEKHFEPRRYLVSFAADQLPSLTTDVLIIGSGAAGLRAAIEAAPYGRVLVITRDYASESNTAYAQGGAAAATRPDDNPALHAEDTIAVGQGLCVEEVVRLVTTEAPGRIRELVQWGAEFDREDGGFSLYREGGHSLPRIVHASGDATGREMEKTLVSAAQAQENVRFLEHTYAIDLLVEDRTCFGALVYHKTRGLMCIWAKRTILATGGAGQLFRETTNPKIATGSGAAMAYRAGAALQDLEFVQFHPTTFYVAGASRSLISETVRGAGGRLCHRDGERFMEKYHPDGELAPRDAVALAIHKEMQLRNESHVWLDLRHLPGALIRRRFPTLQEQCEQFDLDPTADLIPVRPSAHYFVGGVRTDTDGRTNIDGLLACGEVACTGLHGANRLGSNSLVEALVFGRRAGLSAGEELARLPRPKLTPIRSAIQSPHPGDVNLTDMWNSLRSLLWWRVGIEREASGLQRAREQLDWWGHYMMTREFGDQFGWCLQNMLTVSAILTFSALEREETRGVHRRTDFPQRDDVHWQKHSVIQKNSRRSTDG